MVKAIIDIETRYDISRITEFAAKKLKKFIFLTVLYFVMLVLSIVTIVLFGSYLAVFIVAAIFLCVDLFLIGKHIKSVHLADYSSSAYGEIADVHKEIKIVDSISVGGINPFGTRKFDTYKHNRISLAVFIKDGTEICSCYINAATEEHSRYYESKGYAAHIYGTHFPVKIEIGNIDWLCPICGEFNPNEEKVCSKCGQKIIK